MGVIVSVEKCECCHGRHGDLELFAPGIPGSIKVWRNAPRAAGIPWFLCPTFRYAVPVPLAQLGEQED